MDLILCVNTRWVFHELLCFSLFLMYIWLQNQKIGPACKGYVPVLFSDTEKHLLVDAHNTIRNKVASGVVPAANMRMLEWDDELAATADRWAAQCIFGNDICRDLERFPVGQNIARGSIATDGVMHLLEMWYQGAEYINKSIVQSYKLYVLVVFF